MEIKTRKRNEDWIAYIAEREETWECGSTEEESIGKLVVTIREAWSDIMKVKVVFL